MPQFVYAIFDLIYQLLTLYYYVLIFSVVISWLIGFDVVNRRNRVVAQIEWILNAMTEPVLRPLRRIIPSFNGLDLSPLAVVLIIYLIQNLMVRYHLL